VSVTDEQQWPSVVPYVDVHQGPKRLLTLFMSSTARAEYLPKMPPIVSIDGRDYWVYWGQVSFEIPADRPCHVAARCEGGQSGGQLSQDLGSRAASMLLPPGEEAIALNYQCRFSDGVGYLTLS
jgi:hypothetical protein